MTRTATSCVLLLFASLQETNVLWSLAEYDRPRSEMSRGILEILTDVSRRGSDKSLGGSCHRVASLRDHQENKWHRKWTSVYRISQKTGLWPKPHTRLGYALVIVLRYKRQVPESKLMKAVADVQVSHVLILSIYIYLLYQADKLHSYRHSS